MMDRVRRIAYRLGFRPKFESVFYSPSLDYLSSGKNFMDDLRDRVEKAAPRVLDVSVSPAGVKIMRGPLFDLMRYCVLCGARLADFAADVKACPRGCGQAHPDKDAHELNVITFEPFVEGH